MRILETLNPHALDCLAVGRLGHVAAGSAERGGLTVWEMPDGRVLRAEPADGGLRVLAFAPDGRLFRSRPGFEPEPIDLREDRTGERIMQPGSLAYARLIVAARADRFVAAYSFPEHGELKGGDVRADGFRERWKEDIPTWFAWFTCPAMDPEGGVVVTYACRSYTFKREYLLTVHDGGTGARLGEVPWTGRGDAMQAAIPAGGGRVFVRLHGRRMLPCLLLPSGEPAGELRCPGPRRFTAVAAHPTRRLVGTTDTAGVARLWDADSLRLLGALDLGLGRLESLAFSPCGAFAAAGGLGRVAVWDLD